METTERTQETDAIDKAIHTDKRIADLPFSPGLQTRLLHWLMTTWEIYPVVLVAAFLRFYQLNLTEFDTDQAVLWNMAHVALTQGLIPATGNLASIGTVNPPAFIYILMLAGLFTTNPLAGAVLTALLNVAAVLLTYLFTRRYYGRLAGFVAAALTATAIDMLLYSRFIWQPDILAPLTVLYMCALFRGAVARRPGWFVPAVFLVALSLQLGGSSIYLIPALLLALLLGGYKTVRWYDLLLGGLLSGLLFSTYLVWETATKYADLPLLLGVSNRHASIDSQALDGFLQLLSSYTNRPTNSIQLSARIFPLVYLQQSSMLVLIFASFVLLILGLFWKRVQLVADNTATPGPISTNTGRWRQIWGRWQAFIASSQRRGLLLLIAWQLLPPLLLSRHAISVQVHYMLILMPGPFILIGLLVSQFSSWCSTLSFQGKSLRLLVPILSVVLILVQTVGSTTWLLDTTSNNTPNTANFNTLQDLQNAIHTADQLAHKHHLRHIYIDTDTRTMDALNYLAQQMQTANTLIDSNNSHCLLLPSPGQGPALMLFGPTRGLDENLLTHFTSTSLIGGSPRLGGSPFHLYMVQPPTATSTPPPTHTTRALTLEHKRPVVLVWHNSQTPNQPAVRMLVTVWHNHAQRNAHSGSWWTYHFTASNAGQRPLAGNSRAQCQLTGLAPDEQLLVPFALPTSGTLPPLLTFSGTLEHYTPFILNYGPFHFQTLRAQPTPLDTFQTTAQGDQS